MGFDLCVVHKSCTKIFLIQLFFILKLLKKGAKVNILIIRPPGVYFLYVSPVG